jgi:hypothetical protein
MLTGYRVRRENPLYLSGVVVDSTRSPRELRKAELERGLVARRDREYLHSGAHDLGAYAVAPYDPDLDHGSMLATGRGYYQAHEGYNFVPVGNVGRGRKGPQRLITLAGSKRGGCSLHPAETSGYHMGGKGGP